MSPEYLAELCFHFPVKRKPSRYQHRSSQSNELIVPPAIKHVSTVCAQCFYQLSKLRCVRRSLDQDSVATLVQAFVSSRVDYCCSLLTGSLKFVMDKFQKVLNAAARVISNSRKQGHPRHWQVEAGCFLEKVGVGKWKSANWYSYLNNSNLRIFRTSLLSGSTHSVANLPDVRFSCHIWLV